jgi:RNA polymerase sigma-32 factor
MPKRKRARRARRPRRKSPRPPSEAALTPEVLGPEDEADSSAPDAREVLPETEAAPPLRPVPGPWDEKADGPESPGSADEAPETETAVLVPSDALQRYFADIRRSKPLTREEEKALAVRYHEYGDLEAAYALVTANLRLVVKIAMEYQSAAMNLLDLIQEGNIGLMQAVKRFNPYRGVKLSSYASWWIRAFILRYIINNFRLVKIGTTRAQRKLFFNLNRERRRLEAMGYDPSPRLLSTRLDVSEAEIEEMSARMAAPDASLSQPIGDDRDTPLLDFIADPNEGPEAVVAREQARERALRIIWELADTLPEKERAILERRLLAEEPETLQQIGDSFGITKERTRQLEARLLKRLRETLRARLSDPTPSLPPDESSEDDPPGKV